MNNQKGFTLVELVVVIVILGILSAVAVPKFIGMQEEARKGVLEGIRGSLKSAVSMVHAKCLVSNTMDDSTITVDGGDSVDVNLGYPDASTTNLEAMVDLDGKTIAADDGDDFEASVTGNVLTVTYGAYSFTYNYDPTDDDGDGYPDTLPSVSQVQ
jgi:MSHA pilin protein MshA